MEHLFDHPVVFVVFLQKALLQLKRLTTKHLDKVEVLGAAVTSYYKASLYLEKKTFTPAFNIKLEKGRNGHL